MFKYTEKLWRWGVTKMLQGKFYSMMFMSHVLHFAWGLLHTVNLPLLWLEAKLHKAAAFFFHKL